MSARVTATIPAGAAGTRAPAIARRSGRLAAALGPAPGETQAGQGLP